MSTNFVSLLFTIYYILLLFIIYLFYLLSLSLIAGEEFILTFLAGGSWFTKINDKNKTYKRFLRFERQRKMIYYEGSKKRSKGKHLPRCKLREW